MDNSHKALWDNCLQLIKANVTEQQYKTWFAPIVFESYSETEQTLLVQLPSRYVFEYLEQHYVSLLSKVLARVFGANVRLSYRIVEVRGSHHDVVTEVESEGPSAIEEPQPSARVNKSPSVLDAAMPQQLNPQLDPKKTFQNYIEGDSNKLPRTVGLSIAEHPGKTTFNPFFIYGPSGCGKTHLINAIGVRCKETYHQKRVLYVSARLFQVQFTDSVRHNTTNDFINFYQGIDVLILDDVQELSGKARTQDAFFHIFNHLHMNGKQIILTADRPPVKIEGLEDRLLTRFKWGLQAEIEKPTKSLRKKILCNKVKKEGLEIPESVIDYISNNLDNNIRDLEGIIRSLMAYSVVYNCDVSRELVDKIIPNYVEKNDEKLNTSDIKKAVCEYFKVNEDVLCSSSRKQEIVYMRQLTIYLANRHTEDSHVQIGKMIGGRNHSTVIHSIKQVNNLIDTEPKTKTDIESIEKYLNL